MSGLFGRFAPGGGQPQSGYTQPQQPAARQTRPQQPQYDGYNQPPPPGYGRQDYNRVPAQQGARQPQQQRRSSRTLQLQPTKSPDNLYTFSNLVALSTQDLPSTNQDQYLLLNGRYVVSARPLDNFEPGKIGMSTVQREWMSIAMTDYVEASPYDMFGQGSQAYLGSMDLEIGFAGKRIVDTPYDQDELANFVVKIFQNQIFAPGQRFLMDHKSTPMSLVVKTVQLMSLSEKSSAEPVSSDPMARGLLTPQTQINFFKSPQSPINLKASNRRPAANAIVAPDFKFEDMGIGGLDKEFSTIFRRAFASRIFPPGLVEKLGIQHVKGILLYGPPGTGKTLIARQIGKMLNAREPKIINGPEVLNKYVGQSEENIRKLFADAEKEYKEKGDESGLHIIIFDELDAVCKQRGSGAGGGTGVGDSVVNQLLSKLDGVDQLNNILLIGMTNRKDMIDDALLRPGRLEVHMEISLPDEDGRAQILKIHTTKMRDNNVMDRDVDLLELAHLTKNFSGAEIGGLVKSATSFAFNRHVKVGTMAGVSDDVVNMKVNRGDFFLALDEVKPAFGVSEEELSNCLRGGIIHYSPYINSILEEGALFVKQVRALDATTPLYSVIFHGPSGAGKTALAAQIAIASEYPFIKLISPEDMIGFSESAKIAHITKIFSDSYKSPLSVVVIDSIEQILEWVPIGPRFSNPILQTLIGCLRKQPPSRRRLLILATTTERTVLQQLDMFQHFNNDVSVPTLQSYQELRLVMAESRAFEDGVIDAAISEIRDVTQSSDVRVGIKKILLGIETAKQERGGGDGNDRMSARFASVVARAIAERPQV